MLPGKHSLLKALPVELANSQAPMAIITLNKQTPSPLVEMFIKTARAVIKPLTAGARPVHPIPRHAD
jgi:hypothetical protein